MNGCLVTMFFALPITIAMPPTKTPPRIGQIIIVGNTHTRDRVIRRLLDIYPGQILDQKQMERNEQRLRRSRLFRVNDRLGIQPTITVLTDPMNPDAEFKDILIQVHERHRLGTWLVELRRGGPFRQTMQWLKHRLDP